MWNNTARNCQSWLIFRLNNHTCQGGWGKNVSIGCHSVGSRHRTQRVLSSTDRGKCFPLFLIRRQRAIHKSSESCSRSTASQRPDSAIGWRKTPPPHTHTLSAQTNVMCLHPIACRAVKGRRCRDRPQGLKYTYFILAKGRQSKAPVMSFYFISNQNQRVMD